VAIQRGSTGARAGGEAEAQWEEGERPVGKKKKEWAAAGPEVTGKILFQIKFDFWIYHDFGNLHKEI
jgi:hypothetical protein